MTLSSDNFDRLETLMDRGVEMPQPDTVFVASDVDPTRIASGVVLHPGTRLHGASTWVDAGCELGADGPVTVENCQLGRGVRLLGGTFRKSTFLDRSCLGPDAHVRAGCLVEEEARVAHAVGLKQTILFPYVTLGSLINFCDCLLAGGTGRSDHSEVGSSYIHFNFTPHQDKATPSRFGDVPRGVMLDRRPIFLGGQGGAVGPLQVGYNTVVPAGTILRRDLPDNTGLVGAQPAPSSEGYRPGFYRNPGRLLRCNVEYIGELQALRVWYQRARKPFFSAAREPLWRGAMATLDGAVKERVARLGAFLDRLERSVELGMREGVDTQILVEQQELYFRRREIADRLRVVPSDAHGVPHRDAFLEAWYRARRESGGDYLDVVQHLDEETRAAGTRWLRAVVDAVRDSAAACVPLPPAGPAAGAVQR